MTTDNLHEQPHKDDDVTLLRIELGKARREASEWEAAFTAASHWLYEPTLDWLNMDHRRREKENALLDPVALTEYRLIEMGFKKLAQKAHGT